MTGSVDRDSYASEFAARLQQIRAQIALSARTAHRSVTDIELVAVSKTLEDYQIDTALQHGLRVFGENRVAEAEAHWAHRRAQYPDLKLHLIGPLQSNKIKRAVALFDVIETVESAAQIDEIAGQCARQNRSLSCFIQVNIGAEPQKSGVAIAHLPRLAAYARARDFPIDGLMAIPPQGAPAGLYFGLLKKLAAREGLERLSMGMSNDYPAAIAFGATAIRIGTALFGERKQIPTP
ncbi:MAG: YggS family pyridoxal phosphate-dependent enzyme [Alphaproteobacteria bacterium]|nr:YggS family pyridoxal phosphate-dependent enzyme [Alphaproteobacteria bacterium]